MSSHSSLPEEVLHRMNTGTHAGTRPSVDTGTSTDDDGGSPLNPESPRFSCNICLESVTEPVVTQCGHLYCWPCLYKWLEPGLLPGERQSLTRGSLERKPVDESRRVCPVCKAPCSVANIVPIYAVIEPPVSNTNGSIKRNENESCKHPEQSLKENTGLRQRSQHQLTTSNQRPNQPPQPRPPTEDVPARPVPLRRRHSEAVFLTAPAPFAPRPTHNNTLGQGIASTFYHALTEVPPLHEAMLQDPDATAFLSRLLLLLGSFVILCLLLF